jgi:hypothetical protein
MPKTRILAALVILASVAALPGESRSARIASAPAALASQAPADADPAPFVPVGEEGSARETVSGKKLMLVAYSVILLSFLAYSLSLALRERSLKRAVAGLLQRLDQAKNTDRSDS